MKYWVMACSALFFSLCLPSTTLERIALGGCIWEDKAMPFWIHVNALEADLFLFNGDNVYADTEDEQIMREAYAGLAADAGFQKLKSTTRLLATWDDHDYGLNDGGADFPGQSMAQRVFCDFWEIPEGDPRHSRKGVYHSEIIEQAGRRVQVILLDGRSFRDPLLRKPESMKSMPGRYLPDWTSEGSILGEAQWSWLREQLLLPAELRILVSGIQVLPEEHGWESWSNLPLERERLLGLFAETNAQGLLLVSGDRHHCELSRLAAEEWNSPGYPLYEITTSGMNSCYGGIREDEPNRHRISQQVWKENNFGLIEIDWQRSDPVIRLELLHADSGKLLEFVELNLSDLRTVRRP